MKTSEIINSKFNGKIYKNNTIYVNNNPIQIDDNQIVEIAVELFNKEVNDYIINNKLVIIADVNKFNSLLQKFQSNLNNELIEKYMKLYHIDSLKELATILKEKLWNYYNKE